MEKQSKFYGKVMEKHCRSIEGNGNSMGNEIENLWQSNGKSIGNQGNNNGKAMGEQWEAMKTQTKALEK